MSELTFEKFPKIGRLNRNCVITEKVDGTNAQLVFDEEGSMLVGSRTREIFPEGTEGKPKGCDNFGFAGWAYQHQKELFEFLGEGRHYGEWCGGEIQRKYDLDEKQFLLFNTGRFGPRRQEIPQHLVEIGLGVVPVLYEGAFSTGIVSFQMQWLKEHGSRVSIGFMNPEGVVVYHTALKKMFKVTYEYDYTGKGENRQLPS